MTDAPRGIAARCTALPGNVRGALWVMLSAFLLTVMGAMVKDMARDIHSFEIVFFRCLIGAITLLPFILRAGMPALRTKRPFLLLARTLREVAREAGFTDVRQEALGKESYPWVTLARKPEQERE